MTIDNKKCSLMRGCYHLVHKKCFDSLPLPLNGCKFKVCSLCNSAIDKIIPLQAISRQVPSELNLVECEDDLLVAESSGNVVNKPDDSLLSVFCNTLIYICEAVESVETLPLHQILTLTQMKRHLIETLTVQIFSESGSNPDSFMQMLVSHFILHVREEVSMEQFSRIYKLVLKSALSIESINFALNLLMFESISKAEVVKMGEIGSMSIRSATGIDFKMNFIELPERHDLFLKRFLSEKCANCGTVPKSAAICLLCGVLVCVGQVCCREDARNGECCTHRQSCSGSTGVFFIIKSCSLLILSDNIGVVVPAPYVNSFGEHDFDLSSASALFLNKQLYYGKLVEMWRNCELRDFIIRNMGESRIPAHSWSML